MSIFGYTEESILAKQAGKGELIVANKFPNKEPGERNKEVAQPVRVRFTPTNKRNLIVEGILVNEIDSGHGSKGWQILSPVENDPGRVLRVWQQDGEILFLP